MQEKSKDKSKIQTWKEKAIERREKIDALHKRINEILLG